MTGSARIGKIRMLASAGMTDAEIAERLEVSARMVLRYRIAYDIPPGVVTRTREPRHGTDNEYGRHGCRCDECRAAHREKVRAGRARRLARIPADDDPRHGDAVFANNWACPCERCRAAVSTYNATRYERSRQRKVGAGAYWTPAEDRIILANRPVVAARFLDRTPKAVRERRRRIIARGQEAA